MAGKARRPTGASCPSWPKLMKDSRMQRRAGERTCLHSTLSAPLLRSRQASSLVEPQDICHMGVFFWGSLHTVCSGTLVPQDIDGNPSGIADAIPHGLLCNRGSRPIVTSVSSRLCLCLPFEMLRDACYCSSWMIFRPQWSAMVSRLRHGRHARLRGELTSDLELDSEISEVITMFSWSCMESWQGTQSFRWAVLCFINAHRRRISFSSLLGDLLVLMVQFFDVCGYFLTCSKCKY